MSVNVHPTAIIEPGAELAEGVQVGPFCTVGPHVRVGPRVRLVSHVVLEGATEIGADCVVGPFAMLGGSPQHLAHRGEPTRLVIGERNMIREHATMHTGTVGGGGVTRVGSDGLFMVGTTSPMTAWWASGWAWPTARPLAATSRWATTSSSAGWRGGTSTTGTDGQAFAGRARW